MEALGEREPLRAFLMRAAPAAAWLLYKIKKTAVRASPAAILRLKCRELVISLHEAMLVLI